MLFLDEELTLSTTDRYIYDYVCKNLDRVVYMRVRELAEACSVSPSTVMRFCERFGCKGYSEFRFRLQEYAAKRCSRRRRTPRAASGWAASWA